MSEPVWDEETLLAAKRALGEAIGGVRRGMAPLARDGWAVLGVCSYLAGRGTTLHPGDEMVWRAVMGMAVMHAEDASLRAGDRVVQNLLAHEQEAAEQMSAEAQQFLNMMNNDDPNVEPEPDETNDDDTP